MLPGPVRPSRCLAVVEHVTHWLLPSVRPRHKPHPPASSFYHDPRHPADVPPRCRRPPRPHCSAASSRPARNHRYHVRLEFAGPCPVIPPAHGCVLPCSTTTCAMPCIASAWRGLPGQSRPRELAHEQKTKSWHPRIQKTNPGTHEIPSADLYLVLESPY